MSTLSQFFGPSSPIQTVQTGFLNAGYTQSGGINPSIGSAETEDTIFIDITISSVSTAKSFVTYDLRRVLSSGSIPLLSTLAGINTSNTYSSFFSVRLTSSTNLRISFPRSAAWSSLEALRVAGRWTVISYN